MKEKRCDQCKHWNKTEDWEMIESGMGECEAIIPRWEVVDLAVRNLPYSTKPESDYNIARCNALKEARAVVQDGSDYTATLFTFSDFFCALFEEKAS